MKPKVALEDRVEIEELMARYAWTLDTGDFEGYAACFTEDGFWLEHWPQGRCHGREEPEARHGLALVRQARSLSRPPASHVASPDDAGERRGGQGDRPGVRIRCFWSILQHDVVTFENRVFGMGTWDTLAVKEADGEWRLKSVYVDLWINGQVPWVGEARAWSRNQSAAAE